MGGEGAATWSQASERTPYGRIGQNQHQGDYMFIRGEVCSENAEHAHKINLVNKIYTNNSLLEKTLEYAHLLAKRAPLAIKFAKQTLRNTVSMPIEDALKQEVRSFYDLGQSEDLAEGTLAFRERRDAEFKGR